MIATEEKSIAEEVELVGQIPIVPTILEVICRTTGMGFAAIARVTEDQWVACGVRDEIDFGLKPGGELQLETTICNEIRQHRQPVVIDHVEKDPGFCGHHTPAQYGFQSYISVPIYRKDGSFFGTLCAIDPKPAKLDNPQIRGMFSLFTDLIAFHLDSAEQQIDIKRKLREQLHVAELREHFIAVLGHDLRNPLGAIMNSTEHLMELFPDGEAAMVLKLIKRSSDRMAGLIGDLMDLAQSRLGSGLGVELQNDAPLGRMLEQVVQEMRANAPQHVVETKFDLAEPVRCDPRRIAQLLSNLLGNALKHGHPEAPVLVESSVSNGRFLLSVTNAGDPIDAAVKERIFQPFQRGTGKPMNEGLGLGLFIAAQIAHAHKGELSVTSEGGSTRFTLEMPA